MQAQALQKENVILDKEFKDQLDCFLGNRTLLPKFEEALGFARDGFLNEDYIEELNEDADLLAKYEVESSVELLQQGVFRLRSTKGIDVHNLAIKLGLTNWIREEVTFIGTEFVIKKVLLVNDLEKLILLWMLRKCIQKR